MSTPSAESASAAAPKRKRLAYESDSDDDALEAADQPAPLPSAASASARSVAQRTSSAGGLSRSGSFSGRASRSPSPGQQTQQPPSMIRAQSAAASSTAASVAAADASASPFPSASSPAPTPGSSAVASTSAAPASSSADYDPSLFGCRSVSCYRRLNTIDEGSYGVVHRAVEVSTGRQVALKKIKLESAHTAAGFPITSLREINILRSLSHPNIVPLHEVVCSAGSRSQPPKGIYMVLEYCPHDLKALMSRMGAAQEDRMPWDTSSTVASASDGAGSSGAAVPPAFKPFRVPEVKCLLHQLLSGVAYAHSRWVLHRDLKMSNLLYSSSGRLLICDFGMARRYGEPLGAYTPLVVTLWYRSIELLLNAPRYSTAADVWSCGALFAEWILNRPLFTSHSEMEQISKIVRLLGTPTTADWPGLADLEMARSFSFKQGQPSRLRELFPTRSFSDSVNVLTDAGFDLLSKMLTYDPDKRISAKDALDHPYFREAPLPQSPALMPSFPASNEQHADQPRQTTDADIRKKKEQEAGGFYM